MVHPNDDFLSAPKLDYDGFRAALREDWGLFSPAFEANIFAGKVRTRRVFGFVATDLTCNATRVERTESDIRRDDMEYYYAVVQLTGGSTIIQNDRVVNFAAGDVVLLDSTRPVTFVPEAEHRTAQWLSLQLPRQNLVSHLGFEPQGGACGPRSAQASRLLCQLALGSVSDADPSFASADRYMPLVVYDLLGALFAPPVPLGSRHNDKLFMRACHIIKNRFADPDISPREVAAEAGISLRYLQKLFTVRGSTCRHHICSARLDHAARLIERRALIKTGQPLNDIAYACGFRDYTYFARGFRQRFGITPGAFGTGSTGSGNARVRANLGQVERPFMERCDKHAIWPARADATMGDDAEGEEHVD
ncbi:AraC-like DNA-binding protein [Bradyrhizobium japonicum USDA 38]|uniref:helix-turn-helix domain-containing protein n=1 Tax=Bradyrhizobium japonicum TaxID=375 RepID=UPI0003F5BD08|nr:helix-turn-helix domain-containing protein [Bradyrhizobium japonicum]MCS3895206.1 AraC-like DNA-binding protein [Bradyrhizobium japonicum USDA 38]MCS3947721.1 AraC-like DNA-binding protein [Bradyrhizobium japonicum]MCW2344063.1 AraC-like DNA-binding protein [Bradyrhizobium japonicum]